ncbi:hypothetical protein PPERSA_00976 [Pseudocohnilembus persalinus]|uniref:Sperm-tail PG-rich repeat n=1 Tax=Pseudocohnilembus persalinus TaxID=266149 RepID=A0A0V0R8I7_PSEPJ|nr:hypothetical protein PPERSA_00976 [Pseudocohnilembus persalinus]|eukprot:KRX10806.1 hypothetical protein PPERSA_00976 [Pseudocohnilembus persalinus]
MQPSLTFEGAWSLGTSQRGKFWVSEDQKQFPAANNYTLGFQHKPKQREVKFPKGPRQDLADKRGFPGPGNYEHEKKDKYPYNKIQIGEKLEQKYENFVPGPPTYKPDFKASKPTSQQFTMSYKHPKEIISTTPGPNAYPTEEGIQFMQSRTQQSWMRKTNQSGFGTSPQRSTVNQQNRLDIKKKLIRDLGNPGPGEYQSVDSKITTGYNYSFPKGERPPLNQFNDLPGPQDFIPKYPAFTKSNGFSMGVKLNKGMKMYETCSPGPGTYQNLNLRSKKGIRIGTSTKSSGAIGDIREGFMVPGPGQYDQTLISNKESHLKSNSIGLADRPDLNVNAQQNVPGPGTYENKKKALGGPKWSFTGRVKQKKGQSVPGPAQYLVKSTDEGKAISFGTGQRPHLHNNQYQNIGPNSYQGSYTTSFAQTRPTIGGSTRFSKTKKSYEPGPGSYDIPGTIGRIPEYLMLSKKKNGGLLDF